MGIDSNEDQLKKAQFSRSENVELLKQLYDRHYCKELIKAGLEHLNQFEQQRYFSITYFDSQVIIKESWGKLKPHESEYHPDVVDQLFESVLTRIDPDKPQ